MNLGAGLDRGLASNSIYWFYQCRRTSG